MLESHPDVPLINHLKAVSSNCIRIAQMNTTDFGFSQKTKETLTYICGSFHDLGKATSYFQKYLKAPKTENSSLKNHALPSAVFVFYVVKRFTETLPISEKKYGFFLASTCFAIVKRHHGHLRDFKSEISLGDKEDDLKKQYDAICAIDAQYIIDDCLSAINFKIIWSDFTSWFHSGGFKKEAFTAYLDFEQDELDKWNIEQKATAYYFFLWTFSTLLYSDKSDVILTGSIPILPTLGTIHLDRYRQEKQFDQPTTEIDRIKNDAYFSVLNQLEKEFDPKQRFYSITLPTGLGKTLTSLGVALKLKTTVLKEGRIIIAMPFTSIIDQNFEIYEEVFNYPDNTVLLKHHHLSEPRYKEGEDSVRNEDESQYLIETWQSSVVVTTFVQLLECLVTHNKSKLLKFTSLSNSVIILDEVQQIPYHLWPVIRQAFFSIAGQLNCYVILMSATQPLIFHPGKEIKELVANHKMYFSAFNRTKLINKIDNPISLEIFYNNILAYAEENPQKDILVILNTKQITLECFRELRNRLSIDNDIRYLTTLITPYERKQIISEIKSRIKVKRYVIVSTQLVEAGVDFSVDTVFRALAPLDSIIQAAGRANRYNEKKTPSEVFLYRINEQYNISCRLYGKELMLKTELVLRNKQIIEEKEYLPIIAEYFEQVKDLSNYSDKGLLNDLLELNFEQTGQFKLIEEIDSESLFVALNDEAKEVWNEFVKLHEDRRLSSFERKRFFTKIKSKFYDYVINIPIQYGKKSLELPSEPFHGFYLWEYDDLNFSIYKYDSKNLSKNEGYVFQNLSSISI
jgi:CRISPR-associated endonuclease/helicase Cas3